MITDSGVASTYVHEPKEVTAGPPLDLPSAKLKWYELHSPGRPVPAEIAALAHRPFVNGAVDVQGLGFVILHRCGESFYFLIANTWRNENELWETVWFKDGDAMPEFAEFPRHTAKLPTYCVWELAIVGSERQSWIQYLRSGRGDDAAGTWLRELHSGPA